MKKRQNEDGQLTKDDYDRGDDSDDEEPSSLGVFSRASEDEMKTRKVFRVKRSIGGASESTPAVPKPASGNPFAAFSGLATPAPAVAPSNPFAGFSALTSSNTAPTANPFASSFSIPPPANPLPTINSKSVESNFKLPAPTAPTSTAVDSSKNETEYQKKVRKLNQSFLSWADRQIKENAIAVWKDGVKDYIKYQNTLREKYPQDAANNDNKKEGGDVKASTSAVTAASSTTSSVVPSAPNSFSSAPPTKVAEPASSAAGSSFSFSAKPSDTAAPLASSFSFNIGTTKSATTEVPSSGFSFSSDKPVPSAPSSFSFGGSSDSSLTNNAFSFPAPKASAPNIAMPAFSIPGPLASTESKPTFSFNLPPAPAAAPASTFPSFSFNPPPATTNLFQPKTEEDGGGGGDGGDDDDEGEPILEPEKILRNENDKDEILIDVPCKLSAFSKELNEWRDKGKGSFRLTKDPDSGKKRMLVRNTMGKITFNAAFFKSMKFDKSKDSLVFAAFVAKDETSKPEMSRFLIKYKAEDVDNVKKLLESAVADLP